MPDYFIRPYDVLFFRGNKSFYFGAWHTEGVFPPFPSTFQGFIRNKILMDSGFLDEKGRIIEEKNKEASDLIGDDKNLNIEITGPYIMDEEKNITYFETPADLLKKDENSNLHYSIFNCIGEDIKTDLDFSIASNNIPNEKFDKLCPPGFISFKELLEYRISLDNINIDNNNLVLKEDRVAIGLDDKKIVINEMFCVTQYNRLKKNFGFYCNVVPCGNKQVLNITDGPLKFGSEAHSVYVQKIYETNKLTEVFNATKNKLMDLILESKKFRMVLLQHGIFEKGWFPFDDSKINPVTKRIEFNKEGLDLELLCASVGRPIKISGFSLKSNKADTKQKEIKLKPIINAVPAGSVYLFSIKNKITREQLMNFIRCYDNMKINNESNESYSKMGFNHVMIAVG